MNNKIPFHKSEGKINIWERLSQLNKNQKHAVLATDNNGSPYTSLVAFVLTEDCKSVVFGTPKKTSKFNNMIKNRKVSLLIDSRTNSPRGYMHSEAVSIMGSAKTLRKSMKRDAMAALFTKKHRELEGFINASSTALMLVEADTMIHVGKFQTVTKWKKDNHE